VPPQIYGGRPWRRYFWLGRGPGRPLYRGHETGTGL